SIIISPNVNEEKGTSVDVTSNFNGNWKVVSHTGNESVFFDVAIDQKIEEVCLTPKFPNTQIIQECSQYNELSAGECIKYKDVTYTQPSNINLYTNSKTPLELSKADGKFCYTLNPSESLYYKFGEDSIIIVGDTVYDSIDSNVTQETGFAHLNISTEFPYNHLVLYMPFDVRNVSTTIHDWSDYNNDGTINGNPVWNATGRFGGAYEFDRVGDYIDVGDISGFTDNITVSAWVKHQRNDANTQGIVGKWRNTGGKQDFLLWTQSDGDLAFQTAGVTSGVYTDFRGININTWHHVLGVYNGTSVELFVDAVSQGHNDASGNIDDSAESAEIGRYNDIAEFDGTIDEVMIFNTSLKQAQITAIFNNQSSRFSNFGLQTFNQTNVSSGPGDTEDRLNVTLTDYQHLLGSNISVKVNDGVYTNLSSSGTATNLAFTTNPNYINITFLYLPGNGSSGGATFYSPVISENITLTSFTVSGEVADTENATMTNFKEYLT
ncbi:unnamed protein product, partial [marine sediment metagenome]